MKLIAHLFIAAALAAPVFASNAQDAKPAAAEAHAKAEPAKAEVAKMVKPASPPCAQPATVRMETLAPRLTPNWRSSTPST